MAEDLIRMERINKFYGRVQALEDVNFSVSRHEIVGLLGDNGAGKSTLIKVLSGAAPATSGDIFVRGKRIDMRNTSDAIALGIERTERALRAARIALVVIDGSQSIGREAARLLEQTRDRERILFFNKADLGMTGAQEHDDPGAVVAVIELDDAELVKPAGVGQDRPGDDARRPERGERL